MSSLNITGNLSFGGDLKLRGNTKPTFNISNLPASVDEGQSISPTIGISSQFTDFVSNLSVNAYWEISGVGIASTDFENVGANGNPDTGTTLTGYVELTGNSQSKQFAIGIRSDSFTDLNVNETATFSVYSDAARTQLTDSDTFIINDTSMGEPEFDFLLVGSGGAGGLTPGHDISARGAGGGGGGGVLVVSNEPIGIGSTFYCEIAPWTGGSGNGTYLKDTNSTGTIIAYIYGGGRGASEDTSFPAAGAGAQRSGSGGGGAAWYNNSGETTAGFFGNDGGDGNVNGGGGGGGGYSAAGEDAISLPTNRAGDGGDGYDLSNFLSALSGSVAGGGGGGGYYDGTNAYPAGTGGLGGGGNGGFSQGDGVDGTPNTGGGGGGASPEISGSSASVSVGGRGGSGVIYLKYIAPEPLFTYSGSEVVNSYIVSSGGGNKKYWVHKLTTDGALTRTS